MVYAMTAIEEYDKAEQEAKANLSFAELMAFAPATFEKLGFPHRVKDERELVRYADWNFDEGNREYFWPNHFFVGPAVETNYTHDEVELMNRVRDQAVEVTRKLGRAVRPLSGPFTQLGLFRVIQKLREAYGMQNVSVFEIGPGTGYLGAMLLNQGWFYGSMDNAQALYLWQNRLLSHIAGDKLMDTTPGTGGEYQQVQCITVPWWRFIRQSCWPVDIVVSNTNLGEMTTLAMKTVVRNARNMLSDSKIGFFLFTNVGHVHDERHSNREAVHHELERVGFQQVFSNSFQGYVLRGKEVPEAAMSLRERIPLYNPSGREGVISGTEAVRIPRDQEPLDLEFVRLLGVWDLPQVFV